MTGISKRMKEIKSKLDLKKSYSLNEAVGLLRSIPKVKFDETVELTFRLNIDPKKADQMIRGLVTLPHGTGKKVRILVFVSDVQAKEALDAGADYAGFKEYFDKVKNGWCDFDVVVSTPDLMKEVGKLGKVLGPKGLMPSPKAGTVTDNVKKAVEEIKKGKIEYRVDKNGNVAVGIGKLSFEPEKIVENSKRVIESVFKARPSSVKGDFVKNVALSSTMGPGLKIDFKPFLTDN
ncbi:MAG: 50S ribosomal protein L1 [Candidatus Aureabacteria bacterium]|nr:50S ribosomal protein L1 [Candidatus Auribacterota bacterium]